MALQNHVCNLGRGHHEDQFCEIVLNLDHWIRRSCHLKTFLIYSSGGPFIWLSGTICAIKVKAIKGNNSVKLF